MDVFRGNFIISKLYCTHSFPHPTSPHLHPSITNKNIASIEFWHFRSIKFHFINGTSSGEGAEMRVTQSCPALPLSIPLRRGSLHPHVPVTVRDNIIIWIYNNVIWKFSIKLPHKDEEAVNKDTRTRILVVVVSSLHSIRRIRKR